MVISNTSYHLVLVTGFAHVRIDKNIFSKRCAFAYVLTIQ
jgi:hypothetical protein